MSWNNPDIRIAYKGSAAIAAYTIVKFGSDDLTVSPAAAATDSLLGVANELGLSAADVAAGATLDVIVAGVAEIAAGASITRGALVTSDANGKAVAAAPSAGVNNRILGIALKSAASGDIIPVFLSPGSTQG